MSGTDEDGVDRVAAGGGETIEFEQAVGLGMADNHWLDRGPSTQLAFDGRRRRARIARFRRKYEMAPNKGHLIGYWDYIKSSSRPKAMATLWSSTDIAHALRHFVPDVQGTLALSNSDALEPTTVAPGISIVIQSLTPGERSPMHRHSFWHLYIVRSGFGLATTDVEDEISELHPGDILFIPAWAHHAVSNPSGDEPLILTRLQNLPEMARTGALVRAKSR